MAGGRVGSRPARCTSGAGGSSPAGGRRRRGPSSGTAAACPPGPTRSSPTSWRRPVPSARPSARAPALAAPTILAHASADLKRALLGPTLTGEVTWCQLFSEPGSGSDLAGLSTRAVRDGDEWVVNGQKLWNTSAHHADYGMLLARTDWDVPKHAGHHLLRAADAPAGRRGAPAAADERPRLVQRGVPHRRARAGRPRRRRAGRGLGGGADDAGPRARLRHDAPAARSTSPPAAAVREAAGRGRRVLRHLRVVPAAGRAGRPARRAWPRPPAARDDPVVRQQIAGVVALQRAARVDGAAGPGGPGRWPAARCRGLARQAGGERRRPPVGGVRTRCSAAPTSLRTDGPARRHHRRDAGVGAGAVDRRRHRRDPAQHHRRARARPAPGARRDRDVRSAMAAAERRSRSLASRRPPPAGAPAAVRRRLRRVTATPGSRRACTWGCRRAT